MSPFSRLRIRSRPNSVHVSCSPPHTDSERSLIVSSETYIVNGLPDYGEWESSYSSNTVDGLTARRLQLLQNLMSNVDLLPSVRCILQTAYRQFELSAQASPPPYSQDCRPPYESETH